MKKSRKFKNRFEAYNTAKRYHFCVDCKHSQTLNYVTCPACGSKNREYFKSEKERNRAATLLFLQERGKISCLRLHPRFDLKVNSKTIGVYEADFDYKDKQGRYIVEDVKPDNGWIDPLAKWKIDHFQAQYCVTVNLT
jgi:hypothetical protein